MADNSLVTKSAAWSREACDDWLARFRGTAPGGRIGRALKPLVEKLGWPTIRPAWQRYLRVKDPEFATPQDFAEKLSLWLVAQPVNALGHEPEHVPPQDPDARQFFDALRLRASATVQRDNFATWWRPAQGWSWDPNGTLVIAQPSPAFVAWWRAVYMGLLKTCARELGREGLQFRFIVVDQETRPKEG